jgi:hypothetical protein
MAPYKKTKNYFGPEGSDLSYIFIKLMACIPYLSSGWNRAAYEHDLSYWGIPRNGWFGKIADMWSRRTADREFRIRLLNVVNLAEADNKICPERAVMARGLAEASYTCVRFGGGKFYKQNE